MAKVKKQIKKKFRQLGINRSVTKQDVQNVKQHGIGILDETFGQQKNISGVPTNDQEEASAGSAGQAAFSAASSPSSGGLPTLEGLMAEEEEIGDQMAEIGSQQHQAQEILGDLLKAKKATTPHDKRAYRVRKNLGKMKTLSELVESGFTVDEAIQMTNQRVARAQAKIGLLNAQKAAEEETTSEILTSFADGLNAQLNALGMRADFIGGQKNFLASMMAAGGRGGGGGGSRGSGTDKASAAELKRMQSAQSDAGYLIRLMDQGSLSWGGAFNALSAEYPEMSDDLINSQLKGSWNPETGVNTGYAETASAENVYGDQGQSQSVSIELPSSSE